MHWSLGRCTTHPGAGADPCITRDSSHHKSQLVGLRHGGHTKPWLPKLGTSLAGRDCTQSLEILLVRSYLRVNAWGKWWTQQPYIVIASPEICRTVSKLFTWWRWIQMWTQTRMKWSILAKKWCCQTHSRALLETRVPFLGCGNEIAFISLNFRKASDLGLPGKL